MHDRNLLNYDLLSIRTHVCIIMIMIIIMHVHLSDISVCMNNYAYIVEFDRYNLICAIKLRSIPRPVHI